MSAASGSAMERGYATCSAVGATMYAAVWSASATGQLSIIGA